MATNETTVNIVVVGGGPAGAGAAKSIIEKLKASASSAQYKVTLVTARPYFIHIPAVVRATVTSEGELEKQLAMYYGNLLGSPQQGPLSTEIIYDKVVSFTSTTDGGVVTLQSGKGISYSVLVLATGSKWSGPMDIPDDLDNYLQHVATSRDKFAKAKDVVIVGGGAVGIEYAGEIKDFYPDTNVTIVHSPAQLLNDAYPEKWRKAALKRVKRSGVKVIFEDRVEQLEPSAEGTITTKNGNVIQAGLVLPAFGGRPNTSFIQSSLPNSTSRVLTPSGHVIVKPTLQLEGHPRIFALGDIIAWDEQKQAAKAPAHIAVVVDNVLALVDNKPQTKSWSTWLASWIGGNNGGQAERPLKRYKGSIEIIVMTFGRNGGMSYFGVLWGLIFGDLLSRLIKSKGLFIDMTRDNLGLVKVADQKTVGQ